MDRKPEPIKILALEDNPGDFRLIKEILSEDKPPSFLIENKERLSTGLERLREGNIDVILLDLGLPDSSGIETFLQVYAEAPDIPVIILTGIEDDKFALEAVHRGAQDYLFKGHIEPDNMVRAIRYAIERKKIEIDLKEVNENLAAEILERKRIEQALRESEEKWSSLVKNAPDYILIVDRNGTIQFTNSTTPGFAPEDVIGRNIYEFVHPEYHGIHRECIEKIFQKGQADGFEFEITRLDSTSSWFETHLGPIMHNDQVVAATLMAADITERKRAEEALQKLTHDLGERVKELNCLYRISDLIEKQDTLEEIFQGTVELVPSGWQYPEITCARLTLEGQEFKTENFRKTTWKQRSDIAAHGHPVGAIEVAYLEEKPALDEGPFLKEERNLINAIAERLGRVTERVWAEDTIKASLAEKEVLLKEIHHRVRNNLQVIISLFSLQSRRIHDEESLAIFEKCKNRVNSIALVHEKLYESKDLANINFGDYIRTLTTQLLNSYPYGLSAITLNINASEVFLEVNKAIPCALIINELVMNSMKYAFPKGQKGEIRIELKSTDTNKGKITVIVADNGVGLPQNIDINDSKSLGMQIVNALVRQLHGSIKIDRNKGSKFTIEFQINNY